jgi:Chondroitinase B
MKVSLIRIRVAAFLLAGVASVVWIASQRQEVRAAGNTYYASSGQDLGAAVSQLQAGDTLILRDGTYNPVSINCGSNAQNGTAGAPITVRAKNERKELSKTAVGVLPCI